MKKKILVIGYSSFVRRRVIKSLKKINILDIFICSKSNKINKKEKIFFNDYKQALSSENYDYVYISLTNNLHFRYAKMALNLGMNVIVDKPITISFDKTLDLVRIAKKKKVILFELTIFNNHIVYEKILKLIGGRTKIESIHANFNIPLPKKLNLISQRFDGCNYNMGPYAAAIVRLYLSGKIEKKFVTKVNFGGKYKNINKEFNLLIKNKSCSFFGNFSISREYISNLIFMGNQKIIEIPFQAFALPCDKKIAINIKKNNKSYIVKFKDDYIKKTFENLIYAKFNKNYYYEMIILDNRIKKKLNLFN